ncbi:ATP synthase d subunit [Lentinula lateritia]|nr:ATP synthase d subunit [Lentinula lateritia]
MFLGAHSQLPFSRNCTSLGLGKGRARTTYSSQPTIVSFSHYCSVLKNKAIVDEAEKLLKDFKPVTYIVSKHIKTIRAFEAKAVSTAKETEEKIDVELRDLQATLANIEEARPFQDLTVLDIGEAHPRITETVETMMKKGKWSVPVECYKEKFGDLNLM